MEEKFLFQSWKTYLSQVGVGWHSHLLSLPSLGLSLVCKSMESLMRDFLMVGVDEGKGSLLVGWEVIGRSVN